MAPSRDLPAPGTQERKELALEIFHKVDSGQSSFRELCREYGFSGTSVVARLKNEACQTSMTVEIRDAEIARLDAWHERLEEAAEQVLSGDRPEQMAGLAVSAAKISRERRAILAVDIPTTLKVENVNAPPEPPAVPNLKFHMDRLKDMKLYREDEEAVGE